MKTGTRTRGGPGDRLAGGPGRSAPDPRHPDPDPRPYRNGRVIAMSCPCGPLVPQLRNGGRRRHEPIVIVNPYAAAPAAEAIALWRAWHDERGMELP